MKANKKTVIITLVALFIFYFAQTWYSTNHSSSSVPKVATVDLSTVRLIEIDDTNISLTIPKDYVLGATQDDLNKVAKEAGYEAVTLNENGSATYLITKEQHAQMLSDMATGIDEQLAELPGKKPYEDITKIIASDNYSNYDVYTSNKNADYDSSMVVMNLKMFSTMYYAFSGVSDQPLHFNFYNSSDKLIATLDSNIAASVSDAE